MIFTSLEEGDYMYNSRWYKCFVVLLTSIVFLTIIPIKRNNSVQAATRSVSSSASSSAPKQFRSVEKNTFKAVVKTISKWAGHANIEISFTNTGKETIHDWYFTFDYEYSIENTSNCSIVEHNDDLYTISNNNWNQDILPGKTVTIGFTAISDDGSSIEKIPSFYLLNTKTVTLSEKELSYKYEEYSDWRSGFNGALTLTNKTGYSIRDWSISFRSNRPITRVDSASLKILSDDMYTITNDGNNQNISKGKSYRLGIEGGNHDPKTPFELSSFTVYTKKLAIKLSDDRNNNGVADVRETDYNGTMDVTPTPTVTATPIPTPTNVPTSTPTNTPTPTAVTTVTPAPTNAPTVTPTLTPKPEPTESPTPSVMPTAAPTPTGMPEDIDYDKDSDSDGLPDGVEEYYGTDKNKADTDGDGVNDFCELLLNSNPKIADNIGSLDRDGDGLSNAKESEYGTNPTVKDTDLDGLSDGEEYKRYGTDPLKYDTDDDGISDYNEVQLGSNPKMSDSNVQRYQSKTLKILDSSELKGVTEVIVSGDISGSMVENTEIKDIYNKDLQTSSISALVGHPVSIETTGKFSTMTITFKYSDDLKEDNLRIMWFDEENCEYVVLTDYMINTSRNTISVTTNHFSKYMLIDESVWVKTWAGSMKATRTYNTIKPLYDFDRYKDEYSRLKDGDEDGIPDIIETSGMITNDGRVIYTNPNKKDTDGDGLSDGYEMGALCLTDKVFERSSFYDYVVIWNIEMGNRPFEFVYYRMLSDPTSSDSDGDGVNDTNDATPNLKNEPINYILLGLDKRTNKELSCMVKPYKGAFRNLGQKVVVLEIYDGSDYQKRIKEYSNDSFMPAYKLIEKTFNLLNHDLEAYRISDKVKYSYVDKMIIITHGLPNILEFDHRDNKNGYIDITDIKNLDIACKISILDIQACHCGKPYYDDEMKKRTCVAYEFINKPQIDKVYAWTNECKFCFGKNYSIGGLYEEFTLVKGVVISGIVKTENFNIGTGMYDPLQY